MAVMLASGQKYLIFITWATPQRCLSILTAWKLLSPKVFFCPKYWGRLFLFKMSLVFVCSLNTIGFFAPPPIKCKTLNFWRKWSQEGFFACPYPPLQVNIDNEISFLSRFWSWLIGGKRLMRLSAEMGSILDSRHHPKQILWCFLLWDSGKTGASSRGEGCAALV